MSLKKTYIINIDGMRADYVGAGGHQGCLAPTLTAVASQGLLFTQCSSIMPANTGTNHVGILTSAHAGSHGILGIGGYFQGLDFNHFRFSKKYGMAKACVYEHRHLQVPTFFNIIKQEDHMLTTGFISGKPWLGSIIPDQDCDITIYPGNTGSGHPPNPAYVTKPAGYVLGGLAHPQDNEIFPRLYVPGLSESEPGAPPGTINLAPADFDTEKLPSDEWVIDQAIHCVEEDDPDFLYMVLMNMDLAGHAYGSFHIEESAEILDKKNLSSLRNPDAIRDQLFLTDAQVKRFIDFLKNESSFDDARLIITADHGMSTMKTLLSGVSKNQILEWILGKLSFVSDTKYYAVSPFQGLERLDIDLRQVLAAQGIEMRASQGRFFHRYNGRGDYDWCISEGPNGYIFNVSPEVQQQIKTILTQYTIQENGTVVHPIWKVLIRSEQGTAINEFTGKPFGLGNGENLDVIWPDVIVFCRPHYMVPMYNDQLQSALMPLMIKMRLPGFIDLRTATGAHGTYLESAVPLIFVSPSEPLVPVGVVREDPVSVLDILPTLTMLNEWSTPSLFEGTSLL